MIAQMLELVPIAKQAARDLARIRQLLEQRADGQPQGTTAEAKSDEPASD